MAYHPGLSSVCLLLFPRLLFMENGTQDCHTVVNIKDIKDVDAITYSNAMFSRGITAIKITSNCKIIDHISILCIELELTCTRGLTG